MRILGIDFGERRIGLALSDPTGTIASPLPTLTRRMGKRPPIKALAETVAENHAEAIVMGLPLSPAGYETEWCAEIRRVGALLEDRTGTSVHYVDERMTSKQAERAVRSLGLGSKQAAWLFLVSEPSIIVKAPSDGATSATLIEEECLCYLMPYCFCSVSSRLPLLSS